MPAATAPWRASGAAASVMRAAWMLGAGRPCTREAAMAKLKCSEAYVSVARLGMQVLGDETFGGKERFHLAAVNEPSELQPEVDLL